MNLHLLITDLSNNINSNIEFFKTTLEKKSYFGILQIK